MEPYSILAVDHNQGNLFLLEQLMSAYLPDCILVTARSAAEAMALVESRAFDGVLIEAEMPEPDGIDLCRRLKASTVTSRISVLLIADSNSSTPQRRSAGLDAGADDFILRPIDGLELIARIRAMLRRQQTRENAEDQTRQRQTQLAYLSRLSTMGEMSTAIAHELNQPLCAIVASAQACRRLLKVSGSDHPAVVEGIDHITAQAKRAGEIIHRLREFSHRRPTHQSVVPLPEVVRDAVHLIASELQYHHVRVNLSLPADTPPVVGDAMQIEQVLINLIRNAIESMQQTGEGQRELDIRLSLPQTGMVEVALEDTGQGLPDGHIERLFGAFFSTKSQMGIGLTVSRSIIEAHGGQLWAEPGHGNGAIFCFTLPRADVDRK